MKVRFITFGCRLNRSEALEDEAAFIAEGWESTGENGKADLFVVRGCSVTSRAQRDCEKTIASLKRKYPLATVIVRGCLPGRVDDSFRPPLSKGGRSGYGKKAPVPKRTARAYLKIQDGCSGKCTFCIVPKFRGNSKSADFNSLIEKSNRFIDAGYREIVITGCNLSLYTSSGKHLAELLDSLASLDRSVRIRLGSLEPGACARDVLHAFAENPNICRFLHVPAQSGSDRILKAMQRPYSAAEVEELTDLAFTLMPDISLGCDMMAGFPGESQNDFLQSLQMLKRCRFSNIHAFAYSERPGTPAASFPSRIPVQVRSSRAKRLVETVEIQRGLYIRGFIGKQVEVLIEDEKKSAGWTSQYVWFENPRPNLGNRPKRREIASFTVTEVKNGVLRGRQC